MKAIWNNEVIAESDKTIVVEGNHYFPPDAVNMKVLRDSSAKTTCAWKGVASYYGIVVGDSVNQDAAWYYPEPKDAASNIKGHIAFCEGC